MKKPKLSFRVPGARSHVRRWGPNAAAERRGSALARRFGLTSMGFTRLRDADDEVSSLPPPRTNSSLTSEHEMLKMLGFISTRLTP